MLPSKRIPYKEALRQAKAKWPGASKSAQRARAKAMHKQPVAAEFRLQYR